MTRWDDRLAEAVEWRDRHPTRWPSRRSADLNERRVANWLHEQRRRAPEAVRDDGMAARIRALNRDLPGWRDPQNMRRRREKQWRDTARRVAQHVEEHGHLPTESDVGKGARRLGVWLRTQRTAQRTSRPTWTAERQARLDQIFPGWDQPVPGAHVSPVRPGDRASRQPLTPEWLARVDAVARYREETSYLPSTYDDDPEVRHLGSWLDSQVRTWRGTGRGRRMSPERAAHLDKHLPGWRDRHSGRTRRWDSERAEKIRQITEMRARGANWAEIARARGVSPTAVHQFARRYGIT